MLAPALPRSELLDRDGRRPISWQALYCWLFETFVRATASEQGPECDAGAVTPGNPMQTYHRPPRQHRGTFVTAENSCHLLEAFAADPPYALHESGARS